MFDFPSEFFFMPVYILLNQVNRKQSFYYKFIGISFLNNYCKEV